MMNNLRTGRRSRHAAGLAAAACLAAATVGSFLRGGGGGPSALAGPSVGPPTGARHLPAAETAVVGSSAGPRNATSGANAAASDPAPSEIPPSRTVRTFYHPIPDRPEQREQVELWRRAWTEVGWTARVLGMDDAARHPRYAELMARVDGLDWCVNEEFQRLCYVRWIAYAADGPGYVSDYDVLPLDADALLPPPTVAPTGGGGGGSPAPGLPNGGRFTGHDPLLSPLASGTSEEVTRVLWTMLDAAKEHRRPREAGHEDRRTRGMACVDLDGEERFQVTDMQALQIVLRDIWGGRLPPETMMAPHPTKGPPGKLMHAHEFEKALKEKGSGGGGGNGGGVTCPAVVHFSGRKQVKGYQDLSRDSRLGYMRSRWEEWWGLCRGSRSGTSGTKAGATASGRSAAMGGKEGAGGGDGDTVKVTSTMRRTVLNMAAGASLIATVVAATT